MMLKVISRTPVKRSQERVVLEDGSKRLLCYAPHNPHYYQNPSGELLPIDLVHEENSFTSDNKPIKLKKKNVVSLGRKTGSDKKKYLGLRPRCKAGAIFNRGNYD